VREKFSDEALAFYNKHRREIDASVKRAVCIIVESLDPGACPQAVSAMIWNCVKRAVESYFRSGQTAGMVVGKNIMLLIAPHPQGVSINFGHIIDSRVLKQPPRVVPSIKRTRRSVAKMLSDAFAKDEAFYKFYRSVQSYKRSLADANATLLLTPTSAFLQLLTSGPQPPAPAPK